jgi:OPA family sugar phosphate sensor protein UhpC-like MFS transporter
MALDIVQRKATGAALGIVGISSYLAAGLQDVVSGFLIQNAGFDFTGVAVFWLVACVVATLLPVLNWKSMQRKVVEF